MIGVPDRMFSPKRTLIVLMTIIFIVESVIMYFLSLLDFGGESLWLELLIDSALLTVAATLSLIFLVYRYVSNSLNLIPLIELIVVRTGLSMFCVESLIMVVSGVIWPDVSATMGSFTDAAIVTLGTAPFLYFWVLSPMNEYIGSELTFEPNEKAFRRKAWRSSGLTICFGLLIIFMTTVSAYFSEKKQNWTDVEIKGRSALDSVSLLIRRELGSDVADLQIASRNKKFLEFLADGAKHNNALGQDWRNLISLKGQLDQIRYLDKNGMEKIRVQSTESGSMIVGTEDLQSKSTRYYYKKVIKMTSGGIYVSPLDLNFEHGKIEVPHRPVTRIGAPIYSENNSLSGILLMNIDMGSIFKKIREITNPVAGTFMFLNREGYYHIADDRNFQWGFMFPKKKNVTFKERFPTAWADIIGKNKGIVQTDKGIFIHSTVKLTSTILETVGGKKMTGVIAPTWFILWHLPTDFEPLVLTEYRNALVLILIVFTPLFIAGVFGITKSRISHNVIMNNLQHAKERAETSERSKVDFLAAMSHEIRTPMAGVIGMTDLILNSDLSLDQLKWANNVKASSKNLMTILNEILDQSKLEAGKLHIDPVDFHLASLVDDITQLFEPKFDEKGLALKIELDEGLPEGLNADRLRIGQILSNLLSNALKFTSTGSVCIHVGQMPNDTDNITLRFKVTDTGIGLSEEVQRHLFSAFVQADNSTSRTYGGTGLGLSISKQLAELMGGEIGVDSVEGKGSAFFFTIICRRATGKVEVTEKRHSLDRWSSARSLKILVAEDTYVMQHLILAIFNQLDQEVTVADDGKAAVEYVEAEDFDIILMDVRMPVMDGLEATVVIRTMENRKSNIPIIALTADITSGNVEEYIKAGMDAVCAKPVELPILLKTINSVLDEEIYTIIPSAVPAGSDSRVEEVEDDLEEIIQADSFEYLLERVSNLADQLLKLNGKAPPLKIEGVDQDTLVELQDMYEKRLLEQCDKLKSVNVKLAENPLNEEVRDEMKQLTHSLKGGGGTFGYNLITYVVTEADDLLGAGGNLKDEDIRTLNNLVEALLLVAEKRISGTGGQAGRILLQGLKNFS